MHRWIAVLLSLCLIVASANAEEMKDNSKWALASSAEPLTAEDVPADLMPVPFKAYGLRLVTNQQYLLRAEALEALIQLMREAERQGRTLYLRQAYRAYKDEARRYQLITELGGLATPPGESSYQTGLSVTLVGETWRTRPLTEAFADSREAQWLQQHAAEFGFVLRYPEGKEYITGWQYEPWHYRYVGVEAALEMTEQHLCLEEYVSLMSVAEPALIQHTPESVSTLDTVNTPEAVSTPETVSTPEAVNTPEIVNTPETVNTPEIVSTPTPEPTTAATPTLSDPPSPPVATPPMPGAVPVPPEYPENWALSPTGEIGPDGDWEITIFH